MSSIVSRAVSGSSGPVRVLLLGSADPDGSMARALAECFHNPKNTRGILARAGLIPVEKTNEEGKVVKK